MQFIRSPHWIRNSSRMKASRRRWLVFFIVLAIAAGGLYSARRFLPDRFNPWAPLRLNEPPNFLTRVKLLRLRENPAMCLAALSQAEVRFKSVPDAVKGTGCGFTNVVLIEGLTADVGRPFALTCPAAVSLALWEQHVLQPAAEAVFATPVTRIEHFGSYSCRNINHRLKGPRSLHATANAIDLAGFVFSDGRRIRILKEWPHDTPESLFLHEIHKGRARSSPQS